MREDLIAMAKALGMGLILALLGYIIVLDLLP